MNRKNNIVKVLLGILLVVLILFSHNCMTFRYTDTQIQKTFVSSSLPLTIHRENYNGQTLRYFRLTNPLYKKKPLLLFVHGAPGSGMDFENLLKNDQLQNQFDILSIDRLGYGGSEYGKPTTSIVSQVKSIEHILKNIYYKDIIVIGWSYGGPIAVELGYRLGEKTLGVLLIGPAHNLHREKFTTIAHLGTWIPFRWVVSGALKTASFEKIKHQASLKKIVSLWKEIRFPIIHVHGEEDRIVPFYENTHASKLYFPKNILTIDSIEGAGHFIHYKDSQRIIDHIMSFVSRQKP